MNNKNKSDLYVITCAKRLVDYISNINENVPKKFRYSIVLKIDNECLDIIRLLYMSNLYRVGDSKRFDYQKEARTKLDIIDYIFHYGVKRQCYTSHQYEVMSSLLMDCYTFLLKWMHSDAIRKNNK